MKNISTTLIVLGGIFCLPASAALVAHFDFEEGSGNFTDSNTSGGGGDYTGTPDGGSTINWVTTALAPVPSGTTAAISFGGGYRLLTDYIGLAGSGDRTIAAWVNFTGTNNQAFVAWGDSGNDGTKYHFRANDNSANGIVGGIRTEIQGSYETGDIAVNTGEWVHIAAVYGAGGTFGSGQVAHYVNGNLVGTSMTGADNVAVNTTTSSGVSGNSSAVLLGGRRQLLNNEFYNGLMDDVRIYDNALSAAEVMALAVPEPSSALLVLSGIAIATLRRRR